MSIITITIDTERITEVDQRILDAMHQPQPKPQQPEVKTKPKECEPPKDILDLRRVAAALKNSEAKPLEAILDYGEAITVEQLATLLGKSKAAAAASMSRLTKKQLVDKNYVIDDMPGRKPCEYKINSKGINVLKLYLNIEETKGV
jgi:predicted transcriptional regulator